MRQITFVLDLIIKSLDLFSIIVLCWGVGLAFIAFIRSEILRKTRTKSALCNQNIKNDLASYILLSLEILIAADIIETILNPTFTDIALLAIVVVIRTVISYFLNREISMTEQHEKNR